MNEDQPNRTVQCSQCEAPVEEPSQVEDREPCPFCGSLARTFSMTVSDSIRLRESLALKVRRAGQRRPYVESKHGDDYYRATDEWRTVDRVINREADHYYEHIVSERGDVVRHVEEPLGQHRGHGSAKGRRTAE